EIPSVPSFAWDRMPAKHLLRTWGRSRNFWKTRSQAGAWERDEVTRRQARPGLVHSVHGARASIPELDSVPRLPGRRGLRCISPRSQAPLGTACPRSSCFAGRVEAGASGKYVPKPELGNEIIRSCLAAIWQIEFTIMAHIRHRGARLGIRSQRGNGSLGLAGRDLHGLLKAVGAGLSYARLTDFAARSGLALAEVAAVLRIPARTLARRKVRGALTELESERLVRLAALFVKAAELFEGNPLAAAAWLRGPAKALGSKTPLELARTEIGARAVADLMG